MCCHAGSYESSIILAADGDSVRTEELSKLEPVAIQLIEKMREGVKNFEAAGAAQAYCGDPASASAEEGEHLIEKLGEMIYLSARETWPELFE